MLTIGYIYSVFNNWRYTIVFFGVLPSLLLVGVCLCLLEDTPKYVIKNYTADRAAEIFNRIARINCVEFRYTPG